MTRLAYVALAALIAAPWLAPFLGAFGVPASWVIAFVAFSLAVQFLLVVGLVLASAFPRLFLDRLGKAPEATP